MPTIEDAFKCYGWRKCEDCGNWHVPWDWKDNHDPIALRKPTYNEFFIGDIIVFYPLLP